MTLVLKNTHASCLFPNLMVKKFWYTDAVKHTLYFRTRITCTLWWSTFPAATWCPCSSRSKDSAKSEPGKTTKWQVVFPSFPIVQANKIVQLDNFYHTNHWMLDIRFCKSHSFHINIWTRVVLLFKLLSSQILVLKIVSFYILLFLSRNVLQVEEKCSHFCHNCHDNKFPSDFLISCKNNKQSTFFPWNELQLWHAKAFFGFLHKAVVPNHRNLPKVVLGLNYEKISFNLHLVLHLKNLNNSWNICLKFRWPKKVGNHCSAIWFN